MDLKPFKLDIDELINEFVEGELTTLADMKRIWLSKKFSFIYEASPSTNLGCFMQSLYAHSIGYMLSTASLSHRLGGLYCLYCLHDTQPFKPPFRIYLSLGELKRLKILVVDAKKKDIRVVSVLVKSMLERNLFLFGAVDINEGSVTDRVNELTGIQNARVQVANEKLFANTRIENFIHMDIGMELDVDWLKKMSTDYFVSKELAIKEAAKVVDVQNIKHIAENERLIGDVVEKASEDWNVQKELFYQNTGISRHAAGKSHQQKDNEIFEQQKGNENLQLVEFTENITQDDNRNNENVDNDENFSTELEKTLLSCEDFEQKEDKPFTQQEDDEELW